MKTIEKKIHAKLYLYLLDNLAWDDDTLYKLCPVKEHILKDDFDKMLAEVRAEEKENFEAQKKKGAI